MTDSKAIEAARRIEAARYIGSEFVRNARIVARALLAGEGPVPEKKKVAIIVGGSASSLLAALHAASSPSPAVRDVLDWPKILQRYGAIHERISTYEDGDESPALMKLCELRDALLGAVRSGPDSRILRALEDTNVIPGRAALSPLSPPEASNG